MTLLPAWIFLEKRKHAPILPYLLCRGTQRADKLNYYQSKYNVWVFPKHPIKLQCSLSNKILMSAMSFCQQCVEKLSLRQTKKNERLDVCFSSGSICFLREASANVWITAGFVFLRRSQLYQGSVYESTILQECFIKGSISDFSVLMTGWWVEWHDCMELWVNGEWMHSICNF